MKLVILDRDGVVNHDSDAFIKSPKEWFPIPGSLEAISRLKSDDWLVAIATNQSGIARGLLDDHTLKSIHSQMRSLLLKLGADIDLIVYCPHGPLDNCNCRKPRPGLYQQIASHFNSSLLDIPVIGDSKRDLDAAITVGARPFLVRTGKGQEAFIGGGLPSNTLVFDDLRSVVDYLLSRNQ
jgi:D-glycero-D-manno-heptose 1,7-bisphosphate phosphatase